MRKPPIVFGIAAACLATLLGLSTACTTPPPPPPTTTTTSTTAPPAVLKILVTNDDGYAAPGLDGIVEALRVEPDVSVTVVAPLTNQSGAGGKTTPGGATNIQDKTTASGYPAKAVEGFPADSVNWALDGGIGFVPDLVVSGNNNGQNIGSFVEISGTVGAARAGAKRGVPAVAVSQGFGQDFPAGTKVLIDFFRYNRAGLWPATDVWSLNVPSCAAGTTVRGVRVVPVAAAPSGRDHLTQNCASTAENPVDDIEAFNNGFAAQSNVGVGA